MINYIENVFNVAYSYVSSFLWQVANLLEISLETLLYSLVAALVIGMFFLKRSAKETSPIYDNANEYNSSEDSDNYFTEDETSDYVANPAYSFLSCNIHNDK